MKIRLRAIGVCALFAALVTGCGYSSPTRPSALTLTGTVHLLGATTPVAGVTVLAQGRSTTTNANGGFSISGLEAGSTPIDLSKTGYKPLRVVVDLAVGSTNFSIAMEPQ